MVALHTNSIKMLKELVYLSNLDNFELLQAIFKEILAVKVHRINFFCVAETLNFMSPIFFIKQKLSKSIQYNRLKFSLFLYDLSIFRVAIFIA